MQHQPLAIEPILEEAEWRVREAEADVQRQAKLINELRREGHPTKGAEILLTLMVQALEQRRAALTALLNTNTIEDASPVERVQNRTN